MPKTKVEVYDKDQLIYPFIESDHVTFSNGMKVSEMLDQSISMPTVIHEDLSFKVGVGDQDVSSAIVDSSVAEMTIKGKTYQNILPEPSTHVLTNNKEMFKVNEGLDPNVEIVDGVSKSAILSGNTLVNIDSCYTDNDFISFKNATIDSDGWITITANGNYLNAFPKMNNLIKPSTKYLAIIEVKENTLDGKFMPFTKWGEDTCFTTNFQDMNNSNSWVINAKAKGVFKSFLLTKDDYPNANTLERSYVDVACTTGSITYRTMLIEYQQGMENWDIPFFRGMQSVKMPVLTTTGKNLFDGELSKGYLTDATGQPTSKLGLYSTNYMKCSPNSIYTISGTLNDLPPRFYFYDSDKNYLGCYITSDNVKTCTTLSNAHYMRFRLYSNNEYNDMTSFNAIQIEEGSIATPYEPYKTNILTSSEEVVLRGIGNVKDTLDISTGEKVERIGEYTIDGNENWEIYGNFNVDGHKSFITTIPGLSNLYTNSISFISGDFKTGSWNDYASKKAEEIVWNHDPNKIGIKVKNETASNVEELKAYLASNPITFQYELVTPAIKTVDLSSSGNWEKVVLDGSERWTYETQYLRFYTPAPNMVKTNNYLGKLFCDNPNFILATNYSGMKDLGEMVLTGYIDANNSHPNENWIYITVKSVTDVNELKQYLSQNPITVWYQTATHQDSTQVKQPIFFKDGHIIQSSGADNSLIPILDYQAKTSNSYVMDLMKASTIYTMKNDSANGKFTIDGTQYNLVTNGKLKTPTTLTDKLLVINGSASNTMILEGDLTSKTIPYFKGIKSAFEGEDKIEVLSTGKNLFDGVSYINGFVNSVNNYVVAIDNDVTSILIDVEKNTDYILSTKTHFNRSEIGGSLTPISIGSVTNMITCTRIGDTISFNSGNYTHIIIYLNNTKINMIDVQIEQGTVATTYEPYKSNNTKIPLLSPLRSLPNGVCDELIIDRMKKKATLIQRVEAIPVTSVDDIRFQANLGKYNRFFIHKRQTTHPTFSLSSTGSQLSNWCPHHSGFTTDSYHFYVDGAGDIMLFDKSETLNSIRTKMSQSPFIALHQLATPIVTEVDLEGFPYIYKDGHIFLNSEIAPTTEITYSINQCQQISASNEDIIRHEKELTYLQKLIAQYVQVDYESALLSLKV